MLDCIPFEELKMTGWSREDDTLVINLKTGKEKIIPVDGNIVRVLYTAEEFDNDPSLRPQLEELKPYADWDISENAKELVLKLPSLKLVIDKGTNRFDYYDPDGRLLLKERSYRGKELTKVPVFTLDENAGDKEYVDTADGRKELIKDAVMIQTGSAYRTKLNLILEDDEDVYGLGQHEEGYGSLRGKRLYLNQGNRKIVIPMLVSSKGYGILSSTCSPCIFDDKSDVTCFYTEADPQMDFFFINGTNPMGVVKGFRKITGKAAMLPKWTFGYVQSQERYETEEEILSVAARYREKGIGLDCIVLDWMSWPDGQWGQKSFDANRFPDPKHMTDKLHDEHVHFMISIWPNMDEGTANSDEFKRAHLMLSGVGIYDVFNPAARKMYWDQAENGLFKYGVDAWWCDNSEPICPEWMVNERPIDSKNYDDYCKMVSKHIPAPLMNAFGLMHAKGVYDGQRGSYEKAGTDKRDEKRVVNLTRSGYPGQQKYGTILWSGDIGATWDTLRRQIATGLNFCASGMPYWTLDIGAFFVKNGIQWYWDGEYDDTAADPAYCELFVRWYEWGAFLPVFRGHGTDVRRELWTFDRPEAPFYEALLKANRARYELMPYIYSMAGMVHVKDGLMMSPLAYNFKDVKVRDVFDQYMFGESMMICPVTEPMYFDHDGKLDRTSYTRQVILPADNDWYDYHTGKRYSGGSTITADAPLDEIPVYVKAGSIIPKTEFALSTEEQSDDITLYIYAGADASFTLYEDAGDGYGYEDGEYTLTEYAWNDKEGILYKNGEPSDVKTVIIR